jgi:protease I
MSMSANLKDVKIAILVAEGFEQIELTEPRHALEKAGAEVSIVSPRESSVRGWRHFEKGDYFDVDIPLNSARPDDFQALMLSGGVVNPDQLRGIPEAVKFVRHFFDAGKPVAAICHAPWTLIEADVVRGRVLTSWPSLKTDLLNAGADWLDQDVVMDGNLVTSRKPADLPAFNRAMTQKFAEMGQSQGVA